MNIANVELAVLWKFVKETRLKGTEPLNTYKTGEEYTNADWAEHIENEGAFFDCPVTSSSEYEIALMHHEMQKLYQVG